MIPKKVQIIKDKVFQNFKLFKIVHSQKIKSKTCQNRNQ
jgi:hypothetical protein